MPWIFLNQELTPVLVPVLWLILSFRLLFGQHILNGNSSRQYPSYVKQMSLSCILCHLCCIYICNHIIASVNPMQAVTSVFACVDNIHVDYDSFFLNIQIFMNSLPY